MSCTSCHRPEGTVCPARRFIGGFDKHPEERMRVQVAALELARHDLDKDGNPIPLTEEQEENKPDPETVFAFADAYRQFWNRGMRCPSEISKRVVDILQSPRF